MILKNEHFGYPSFATPEDKDDPYSVGIVVMETYRGSWVWWDLYSLKPVDLSCEESIWLLWEAFKNGDDEVDIPFNAFEALKNEENAEVDL